MPAEVKPLTLEVSPHISALLIGPGGFGKTTALVTLPKPLLIADCDGGIESLFNQKTVSEKDREGVSVTRPTCFADLLDIVTVRWSKGPGGKPFASLAIDTLSWAMGNIIKAEILSMAGREKMEKQDWGLYLERGIVLCRKAHELAMRPDGCHVVMTAHETDRGGEDNQMGKLGPAVQGQLFDILPGIPNFVFFLKIIKEMDPKTRKVVLKRMFQTGADAMTPAKSRRDLELFIEPNFTKLWEEVAPLVSPEALKGGMGQKINADD